MNPQIENGYTRIANELLEALGKTNLSSYQSRILFIIIRKTYGFQKKDDWISNSQFVELTGIRASHVSRAISELIVMNVVTKGGKKISLQKDFKLWLKLPKGVRSHHLPKGVTQVTKGGNVVTKGGISKLPKGGNTKETITKDTYTKETITKESSLYQLDDDYFQLIANQYNVPIVFVRSKFDDLVNYCERTGRKYKDYKAALRNFVKEDALKIRKEEHGKSKITVITPDPNWETK